MPRLLPSLTSYFVISCSLPLSSLKKMETTPVLASREGFPMQQNFLKLSKLKMSRLTMEWLCSLRLD